MVEKTHCKNHDVDFNRLVRIKVSCPRYEQCREAAIVRHKANLVDAKREAEKEGRPWMAVKAVLQIVCPYEKPPQTIPQVLP